MSILLGLSGSKNSELAARTGWDLAKRLNCRVTAEHVIDTTASQRLLSGHESGLTNKEALDSAYLEICNELQGIAEQLRQKYLAVFDSQNLNGQCIIDFGNPVQLLSERANHYDLMIVGKRYHNYRNSRTDNLSDSVSLGMAEQCTIPLLMTSEACTKWNKIVMIVSANQIKPQYIKSCLSLANLLKIAPELVCISTENKPLELNNLGNHLRHIIAELKDVPISYSTIKGENPSEHVELWSKADKPINIAIDDDVLLVVPTQICRGQRITIFGDTIDQFLKNLNLPQVLLWPVEYEADVVTSRMQEVLESRDYSQAV